jgi:multiple sugar transport system permease protein
MRTRRFTFGKAGYAAVLAIGIVVTAFPLFWMVRGALIPQAMWTQVPLVWFPAPSEITFEAFEGIFTSTQFRMGQVLFNTMLLAVGTMLCRVLFDCMAGFALAKMRVPGKRVVVLALILTLMVPFEGLMVSLYLIISKLGLYNTWPGILLPCAASAFGIILMERFFSRVPDELIEAAVVDGAGWGTIFFGLAMPLAAPSVATVAVLSFLAGWDQFIWPLLITDPGSQFDVLQKVLANATMVSVGGGTETEWPWLMAGALVATVPVLLLFVFCQRFFVAGLSAGGVKE